MSPQHTTDRRSTHSRGSRAAKPAFIKPSFTKQQIFDRVWDHFVVKLGTPSVCAPTRCLAYHGPAGERCPIGLLLPDDVYRLAMEGTQIRELIRDNRNVRHHFRGVAAPYLTDLQALHDDCVFRWLDDGMNFHREMEHGLRKIAYTYNLRHS